MPTNQETMMRKHLHDPPTKTQEETFVSDNSQAGTGAYIPGKRAKHRHP